MTVDLYATIFVDTTMGADELRLALAQMMGGAVENFSVSSPILDVGVTRNSDFVEPNTRSGKDDFLFFRYRLEVEPRDGVEEASVIAAVASVLEALWQAGAKAVTSCGYEERLPRNGGLDSYAADP